MGAILVFLLALTSFGYSFQLKPQSKAVLLMDAATGKVLFEKNGKDRLHPASTTKMATVLYALTLLKEHEYTQFIEADAEPLKILPKSIKIKLGYTCPAYFLEPSGTSIEIKKEEKLTIETLLYAAMIASANDAANLLAYHLGNGRIEQFVFELNQYLRGLGCIETTFMNPHGLTHPDHQTTAYDLALIAREAMKVPLFRKIVKSVEFVRSKTNKNEEQTFVQTNRLVREGPFYFPSANGIKTGYTEDAQYCLVSSARHEDRELIAVVLGSPTSQQRYTETIELFTQAFEEKKIDRILYNALDARFKIEHPDAARPVELVLKKDLMVTYYPSMKPDFHVEVALLEKQLPFYPEQEVAILRLFCDQDEVGSYPLYASRYIGFKPWLVAKHWIQAHLGWIFLFFTFLFYGFLLIRFFGFQLKRYENQKFL